jgi:hypothetical protein
MITGECIISYPALFEPKKNPSGAMKYSCSLLIEKTDASAIATLTKAIDIAILKGKETKWSGKTPKFRYQPLRDGDEELESGDKTDPVYKGKVFLNCSSDTPPGVVDPHAKTLMDQNKIYAGCIVRADINPFPYKKSGNSGVGWGLNNIMLIADGPRLDGKQNAEDAFSKCIVSEDGGDLM